MYCFARTSILLLASGLTSIAARRRARSNQRRDLDLALEWPRPVRLDHLDEQAAAPPLTSRKFRAGRMGKYTEEIGSGRDPLKVFTVATVDGEPAIRISGEAFGELRTVQSFHDYRLKLQFKWGTLKWLPRNKPEIRRDSGLLYHVHAPPGAEGRTWARVV